MLKIISFGIVETVGFGTILGTMIGMGVEPDFSFPSTHSSHNYHNVVKPCNLIHNFV